MSCALNLNRFICKRGDSVLLEDVYLHLGHKEKILLFGANGSGKSTFLRAVCGLSFDFSGGLEIFHNKIETKSDFKKVKQDISILFQNSEDQFISTTVIDDVIFGLLVRGVDEAMAIKKGEEMLEFFEISHLRDKEVFFISGGEQRLVSLASLLITEPKLMLLDEPTNGLDNVTSLKIVRYLQEIDRSMIIATHDREFAKNLGFKIYEIVDKKIGELVCLEK